MANNLNILQDHYLNVILTHSNLPYDDRAFFTATNWAKKRYRARLAQTTVEAAQTLLQRSSEQSHVSDSLASSPTGSLVGDTPPRVDLDNRREFPPLIHPQKPPSNPRSLYLGPRTPLTVQTARLQQRDVESRLMGLTAPATTLNAHSTLCLGIRTRAPPAEQSGDVLPPPTLSPIIHISKNTPLMEVSPAQPQSHSHLPPPGPDFPPRVPFPPPPPPQQAGRRTAGLQPDSEPPNFSLVFLWWGICEASSQDTPQRHKGAPRGTLHRKSL